MTGASEPAEGWSRRWWLHATVITGGYLLFLAILIDLPIVDVAADLLVGRAQTPFYTSSEIVHRVLGSSRPGVEFQPVRATMRATPGGWFQRVPATGETAPRQASGAGGGTPTGQRGNDWMKVGAATTGVAPGPAPAPAQRPDRLGEGRPSTGGTQEPLKLTIPNLVKAIAERPWDYDHTIDRYVVRVGADTRIVLTLRPALQRRLEQLFPANSCRLGVAVVQDPLTGAILGMVSFDGSSVLPVRDPAFRADHWALKNCFPPASLLKIVTAAAAIENGKLAVDSTIRFGRKASLEFWRAFALSHNSVFIKAGNLVGAPGIEQMARAMGFNRPFFFDLPVEPSMLEVPTSYAGLGNVACGLDKAPRISPLHVTSMISAILNRGRVQKPVLIEKVIHRGRVVFVRKPFTLGQSMKPQTADKLYQMMLTTTTHGTGRRGFGRFTDSPELAHLCGGKTGTLTGVDPKLFFTWFGGFTKAAGRDLAVVTLVGHAPGTSGVKAATLAGRFAHELYLAFGRRTAVTPNQQASASASDDDDDDRESTH